MSQKKSKTKQIKTIWHPDVSVSQEALVASLSNFGEYLPEPLSDLVDLDHYAVKIRGAANIAFAEIDNEPAGILSMYANNFETRAAFISIVSVSPKFRGCGVGATLISQAINRARDIGMNSIILKVLSSNKIAISLYKSFGFEPICVLSNRLQMRLDIFGVGGD